MASIRMGTVMGGVTAAIAPTYIVFPRFRMVAAEAEFITKPPTAAAAATARSRCRILGYAITGRVIRPNRLKFGRDAHVRGLDVLPDFRVVGEHLE